MTAYRTRVGGDIGQTQRQERANEGILEKQQKTAAMPRSAESAECAGDWRYERLPGWNQPGGSDIGQNAELTARNLKGEGLRTGFALQRGVFRLGGRSLSFVS